MQDNHKYFYAADAAQSYDRTIEAVVPNYKFLINSALIYLSSIYGEEDNFVIQDIGAGTGNDVLPILTNFPNSSLYAWDLYDEMKREFESNARSSGISEDRFTYMVENYLDANRIDREVDVSLSGYCIHHYDMKTKKRFFSKIFRDIKEGGHFVLIDLANFESSDISKFCHQYDIDHITNSFDRPIIQKLQSMDLLERKGLKEKWIDHMNNENILDTGGDQIQALRDVGFSHVECITRFFQHSIIICKK